MDLVSHHLKTLSVLVARMHYSDYMGGAWCTGTGNWCFCPKTGAVADCWCTMQSTLTTPVPPARSSRRSSVDLSSRQQTSHPTVPRLRKFQSARESLPQSPCDMTHGGLSTPRTNRLGSHPSGTVQGLFTPRSSLSGGQVPLSHRPSIFSTIK